MTRKNSRKTFGRRIAYAKSRGSAESNRKLMHDMADEADDNVSDAIAYYELGKPIASIYMKKARSMLAQLDDLIYTLSRKEDGYGPEDDGSDEDRWGAEGG